MKRKAQIFEPWDAAEQLRSEEEITAGLQSRAAKKDPRPLIAALGYVAHARAVSVGVA
jgi:DNA-binding phage protein